MLLNLISQLNTKRHYSYHFSTNGGKFLIFLAQMLEFWDI